MVIMRRRRGHPYALGTGSGAAPFTANDTQWTTPGGTQITETGEDADTTREWLTPDGTQVTHRS